MNDKHCSTDYREGFITEETVRNSLTGYNAAKSVREKVMVATTPVTIPIRMMTLSPGSHLLVEDVSWQQYEALLAELGDESSHS